MRSSTRAALIFTFVMASCANPAPVNLPRELQAQELIDRGTLLLRQHNYDQAAAAFQLSMEIHPSASALDGLGCVVYAQGNLALAEALFSRALQFDPNYVEAERNLTAVSSRLGRAGEAEARLRKVLLLNPEDFRARNNLAAELYAGGEDMHAREMLLGAALLADHEIIGRNLRELDLKLGAE